MGSICTTQCERLLMALITTSSCHISSRKAVLASYLRGAAFRQAFHTFGLRLPTHCSPSIFSEAEIQRSN